MIRGEADQQNDGENEEIHEKIQEFEEWARLQETKMEHFKNEVKILEERITRTRKNLEMLMH